MPGTAIFDLDRTITRQPTWTRFCFYANRDRLSFWLRVPLWMGRGIALKLGLADRQAYKHYSLRLLSELDHDLLMQRAREFAERDVARGLRPGSAEAIRRHREAGDRLIMATACCEFLAAHYGELLGFDQVVATRLDWDDANLPAPRLEEENCYGAEKRRRLSELDRENPFTEPRYAYSDHISDLEMLRQAEYGYAVNPSKKLRKVALHNALIVVDFDTTSSPKKVE